MNQQSSKPETTDDPRQWATQTHQETLRLLIFSDTSPPLYSHEVTALQAAIEALNELEQRPRGAAEKNGRLQP